MTDVQAGGQPSTTMVAIIVTAADTNTRLTYTVTVTRETSETSELSLRSIKAVVTYGGYWVFLSPAFDASEVLYWSRPGYNRTLLTVTPVLRDPAATMRITPRDADVYAAGHQIRVAEGKQNALTVTVTSANGAVSRRHWVVFDGERVGDPHAETMPKLGGLEFGGLGSLGFAAGQYRYEIDAVPGVTQATVVAVRDELRAPGRGGGGAQRRLAAGVRRRRCRHDNCGTSGRVVGGRRDRGAGADRVKRRADASSSTPWWCASRAPPRPRPR